MYIVRILVLAALISVCVPLAARAQAIAGPIIICPLEQAEPLEFKNPFLPAVSSQQLPAHAHGLNVADITPPREFRSSRQRDLIVVDAEGVLRRVPLQFPCGFYGYPQAERSAGPQNRRPESDL